VLLIRKNRKITTAPMGKFKNYVNCHNYGLRQ